jgi:hypothetical protein
MTRSSMAISGGECATCFGEDIIEFLRGGAPPVHLPGLAVQLQGDRVQIILGIVLQLSTNQYISM